MGCIESKAIGSEMKAEFRETEIAGMIDVRAMDFIGDVLDATRCCLGEQCHKLSCELRTKNGSCVLRDILSNVALESTSVEIRISDLMPDLMLAKETGEIVVLCELDKISHPLDWLKKMVRALARKIAEQYKDDGSETAPIIALLHHCRNDQSSLSIVWGTSKWLHLVGGSRDYQRQDFWTILQPHISMHRSSGDFIQDLECQTELINRIYGQDGISLPMILSGTHAEERGCILSVQIIPLTDIDVGIMACQVHAIMDVDIKEDTLSDCEPDISMGSSLLSTRTKVSLFDTIQMGTLIGKGGYGSVFRAVMDGQVVALKVLDDVQTCTSFEPSSGFTSKIIGQQEIEVGKRLDHENIVKTIDYATRTVEGRKQTWIILELCESGSLRHLVEDKYFNTISKLIQAALEIARGMAYLHSQQILHGDLSSNNVLFDRHHLAKISDFGLSRDFAGVTVVTSALGTTCYMAPELLSNGQLNKKSDVYSYGVLVLEMLTGKRAFSGMRYVEVITSKLADDACTQLLVDVPNESPEILRQLVADCTRIDYAHRPSFDEIVSRFECLSQMYSDNKNVTG